MSLSLPALRAAIARNRPIAEEAARRGMTVTREPEAALAELAQVKALVSLCERLAGALCGVRCEHRGDCHEHPRFDSPAAWQEEIKNLAAHSRVSIDEARATSEPRQCHCGADAHNAAIDPVLAEYEAAAKGQGT